MPMRSDIYSLGISLWYLLTGRCAYDGDTLMSKLLAHRDAPIPSLASLDRKIPAALDSVFRKMVAKNASERYQTMAEVIRDLESCSGGSSSPSEAGATSDLEKFSQFSLHRQPAGSPSPMTATQTISAPREQTKANTPLEATLVVANAAMDTNPQTVALLRPQERLPTVGQSPVAGKTTAPPWYRSPLVLLAGGGAAALILLMVVFLMKTPHGTLRVEILDPKVEMKVKGTEITFHSTDIEAVSLVTGEKKLIVNRGDLSFETETFALKKGAETLVKVELIGDQLVVNSDGKVIAEKPIPHPLANNAPKDMTKETIPVVATPVARPPVSKDGIPNAAVEPFDTEQAHAYQEAWAKYLQVPVEFTNSVGMKFILVPPGEFTMGASEAETDRIDISNDDEEIRKIVRQKFAESSPPHRVKITRPFYMQTHEVNNGVYQKLLGKLPEENDPARPEMPVMANVSLNDAVSFCDALSKLEGKTPAYQLVRNKPKRNLDANGYRLPTEAEWEYACRAGTTTLWHFKTEPMVPKNLLALKEYQTIWSKENTRPNPFGIYDQYASSSEWCFDRFQPYSDKTEVDPFTPPDEGYAVVRGGSFFSNGGADAGDNNSFIRMAGIASRYTGLGRVVLPLEIKQETPKP